MSNIKKTFARTKGRLNVMMKSDKNLFDESYLELEKGFKNMKKVMADMKSHFDKFVEPRRSARGRIGYAVRKNVSRDSKESTVEVGLEDFMAKNGTYVNMSASEGMMYLERCFNQLGTARERYEMGYIENVRHIFKEKYEDPGDEIENMKQKVVTLRANYEAEKNVKNVTAESVRQKEEVYLQLLAHRQSLMRDYVFNNHKENVMLFRDFMSEVSSYYAECAKITASIYSDLSKLHDRTPDYVPVSDSQSTDSCRAGTQPSQYNHYQDSQQTTGSNGDLYARDSQVSPQNESAFAFAPPPAQSNQYSYSPPPNRTVTPPNNANPFAPPPNMNNQQFGKQETRAEVLFEFLAESAEELSCEVGSVVVIEERIDENWYNCSQNGRVGFVPVSYLKIIK